MNLANKITVVRILLVFVLLAIMLIDYPYKNYILAGAFLILALTDALDGYVARKIKKVTAFGKVFDQIADKLLVTLAFLYLITLDSGLYWMIFIILTREFLVSGFRMVAGNYGAVIQAKTSGKIKMFLQCVAIIYILLGLPAGYYVLLGVTIFTAYTGIDYFIKIDREIKKNIRSKKKDSYA